MHLVIYHGSNDDFALNAPWSLLCEDVLFITDIVLSFRLLTNNILF